MKEDMIFKNNIIGPADAMLTIQGYYTTSKDEKVIIETKDINREKRIDIKIRGFSSLMDAKKIAEVLNLILVSNNGFIRSIENMVIEKNKEGNTYIILK